MFTFFIGIIILILGYFFYGKLINRKTKPDPTAFTPAYYAYNKSDYVPIANFKTKMILALAIIGAGPVFGPISAAIWGPAILIIIPIGNIVGGGIHDYFMGFSSMKNKGRQLSWMGTKFLGVYLGKIVLFFIIFLLLLVSSVFVYVPLDVLGIKETKWVILGILLIFVWYFISAILPINKVMAKFYPIVGVGFIIFALISILALFWNNGGELWDKAFNKIETDFPTEIWHEKGFTFWGHMLKNGEIEFSSAMDKPIIPGLFITITCGIISGFHATQSPIAARIIKNEKQSLSTFYGMMNLEAIVAMIWAFLTIWVLSNSEVRNQIFGEDANIINPGKLVVGINKYFFGSLIGQFAVVILIMLPLTSGETGFRALRLTISDAFNIKQDTKKQKILVAIPIFVIGALIVGFAKSSPKGFGYLWQGFAWFNIMLATIALLVVTHYLYNCKKNANLWIFTFLPMMFWMFISFTTLFWYPIPIKELFWWSNNEKTGLIISSSIGLILTLITSGWIFYKLKTNKYIEPNYQPTNQEIEKAKKIMKN